MHILVTNDDGVYARQGLLALAVELRKMGKVSIVAPDHNWSSSGHVKTLRRPLRVKRMPSLKMAVMPMPAMEHLPIVSPLLF